MADFKQSLKTIIESTVASPKIVNESSNFVVCTYWWGRGNKNANTSRPCLSFYEELVNIAKSQAITILEQTMQTTQNKRKVEAIYDKLEYLVLEKESVRNYLRKKLMKYGNEVNVSATGISNVVEYVKNEASVEDKRDLLNCKLKLASEKYKGKLGDRVPPTLDLENVVGLQPSLLYDVVRILILYIHSTKAKLLEYAHVAYKVFQLRQAYSKMGGKSQRTKRSGNKRSNKKRGGDREKNIAAVKEEIGKMLAEKNRLTSEISKAMNVKREYSAVVNQSIPTEKMYSMFKTLNPEFPVILPPDAGPETPLWTAEEFQSIQNKSITMLLTERLSYIGPLTYDQMILEWERACEKAGCNHMAIEYPDFAKPGGYQMAINAKPLFIKKALELCGARNVLYIDGDMTINKYPHIFDITDVDYMARGWWMDPRSSYRMHETIMYDPYLFETSGGTMFFSQSMESKRLIDLWISESDKPRNAGKADDRIISLIFNAKRLLLNMKIIQLPIEYLWLSLDYDDRMEENVDWEPEAVKKIHESIFIEHPECLTSEDTAAGAGASSDRTPKFYSAIGENVLEPVSELMHESVMFSDPKYLEAFREYFTYMRGATYLDDGNPMLYEKKYVDKERPENNEAPLYVIPYEEGFGNKKTRDYGDGEIYSVNEIVAANMKASEKIDLESFQILNIGDETRVELRNERGLPDKEVIRVILRLLREGKSVYYNPVHKQGYNEAYYRQLLLPKYSALDFVFSPEIMGEGHNFHSMFRPKLHENRPMFFKSGNRVLIQLLSMFISFDELSEYLHAGSYEFLSRLRIGYLLYLSKEITQTCKKTSKGMCIISGGQGEPEDISIDEYNDMLDFFYSDANTSTTSAESSSSSVSTAVPPAVPPALPAATLVPSTFSFFGGAKKRHSRKEQKKRRYKKTYKRGPTYSRLYTR